MDKKIIDRASQRVQQNMAQNKKKKTLPKPRTVTEVSAERLKERTQEAVAPSTGYPELDGIIKGFIPGHLYTLTGDTNVGKTTLACNFAVRVAKQNRKALYFALEPENTVVDYLASVRTNKKFDDLTSEDISKDDGNIHIFGKEEVSTIDDMIEIIDNIDVHYDLIVIDHIGYFISGGNNWLQEQSNAIKKLAGLTKRKKVAIMVIAHLRKKQAGQKKDYVPTSDDISGSGAFKQDSTEVMIVTRDVQDTEGSGMEYSDTGRLYVTKTKSGPNGSMALNFQERKANIFSDAESLSPFYRSQYPMDDEDDEWVGEVTSALF